MSYLEECQDLYVRTAIGEHVHIPLNLIFQDVGEPGKCAGIFQFQTEPAIIRQLLEKANLSRNHVLLIGDAFVRPKIVVQSRHLMGCGIAGIYTSSSFASPDEWLEHGKILKSPR